jgi:hypothetical protein
MKDPEREVTAQRMLHDVCNQAVLLILPPVRVPLSNGAKREAEVSYVLFNSRSAPTRSKATQSPFSSPRHAQQTL